MAEHDEQVGLFTWVGYNLKRYPQLRWIHAIPNGGKRHRTTAINLKKEGVKSGVLDVFLPVPSKIYHGLYIEMKYDRNKLTENQKDFAKFVQENDYAVAVCYNWESAVDILQMYLKNEVIPKVEVKL